MPSYIGHITTAKLLLSKLNISHEDQIKFIIGNIVPDIKQVDIDYTLDEFVNKKNIQKSKRVTHFRKNTNKILEYPHLRIFLEKYREDSKEHIETFAYLFHLYTDHYYFKFFLPKVIKFYNYEMEEVDERDNFYYVKILKNNKILKAKTFFSKLSSQGLYKEYSKCDSFLINKYHLKINVDLLRRYVKKYSYNCYVEEIKITKIYDVFDKIERILKNKTSDEMMIFEPDDLERFVVDVVDSFCEEYSDLISNYL